MSVRYGTPTHGHSGNGKSPTYQSWQHAKARCNNPNSAAYAQYGARGITFCERWASFEMFLADMGERPAGTTLDRVDGAKGYSPDNCRWATWAQQRRNVNTNVWITHNGETLVIEDWAKRVGITAPALSKRLRKGWPIEEALTRPPCKTRNERGPAKNETLFEIDGERKSIKAWARHYGVNHITVYARINTQGWDTLRAVTTPALSKRK